MMIYWLTKINYEEVSKGMNVCQVSGSEVSYETAKAAPEANSSNGSSGFKSILKDKTNRLKSGKSKAELNNKVETEKAETDDTVKTENSGIDDKADLICKDILMISQTAAQIFQTAVALQDNSAPAGDIADENSNQAVQPLQNVFIYTADSLGTGTQSIKDNMVSLKGSMLSNENIELTNDDKTSTANGQEILAADVKKENTVLSANSNAQSTGLNEESSQKSSEKTSDFFDAKLTDESNDDLRGLSDLVFKPTENKVNIKVAEPVTEKSLQTAVEDIGKVVVENIKDNKIEKLNISLNPKELGEIKVEFEIKDNGISVSFICSNEKTKRLLTENTDTLSRIIQSNLKQETTVNVSYSEKSSNNRDSANENFDGKSGNGGYKDGSNQNNRRNQDADTDFIQKLRLGILDMETTEV